jgi:hypothetical protein
MKDLTKMMLFMFLGLIVAILVLGFHKSGEGTSTAGSNPTSKEVMETSEIAGLN